MISFGLFFDENDMVKLGIDCVVYAAIPATDVQLLLNYIKINMIYPFG